MKLLTPSFLTVTAFSRIPGKSKLYEVASIDGRWCLYLRHISGKGYEFLGKSGCLNLPSSRTLRDNTYYNQTNKGFSAVIDSELLGVLKRQNLTEDWQKLVILLDEV